MEKGAVRLPKIVVLTIVCAGIRRPLDCHGARREPNCADRLGPPELRQLNRSRALPPRRRDDTAGDAGVDGRVAAEGPGPDARLTLRPRHGACCRTILKLMVSKVS